MRPDSSGLATFTCLYVLIKRVKLLTEKRTWKASFFSRKQRESESLAEVQFEIDRCRLVSQSNYLNNSNKDCDWLTSAYFISDKYTADATFTPLENKIWLANAWGNYWILYHKTNKEASTVLCFVVNHLESGRALKKWGKTLNCVSCFPLHFFCAVPLPACFKTEQTTAKASLFVYYYLLSVMQIIFKPFLCYTPYSVML